MPPTPVLVVDDDELSRDLVRIMLERSGVEAELVASGAAGWAALDSGRPYRLVLIDLKLPDIDGLELVERVRARGPAAPAVVVISGAEAEESRERCRAAGCAGFLPKPFTYQEFFSVVGPLLAPG